MKRDGFTVSGSSPPCERVLPRNPAPHLPAPSVAPPVVANLTPLGPYAPRFHSISIEADLFAVPLPLPDPAVGRRERRKVRRQAQYDARRAAGACVACGRLPGAAAHLSRCTTCLQIQIRSACRRTGRSNSQSTAHPTGNRIDTNAETDTVTKELERRPRAARSTKEGGDRSQREGDRR